MSRLLEKSTVLCRIAYFILSFLPLYENNMLVNVVIPVYLPTLSQSEVMSLQQCLSVLKDYPITLVTHREVDVSAYQNLFIQGGQPFKVAYFDSHYFGSVFAYSRLLLSREFYARFQEYEFILIYQLDGFVFRDELTEWCDKDFDYIGAPWFKHYGVNYEGPKLWKVGNGGVSLRKVSTFLNIFDQPFPCKSSWFFIKSLRKKKFASMFLRTLKMMLILTFARKTVEYILQHFTDERVNEDCFWAESFVGTSLALNIPDVLTAARFCLEKKPSYVYGLIGNQLPFTCHAFEKYEYESFWKDLIERNHAQNIQS